MEGRGSSLEKDGVVGGAPSSTWHDEVRRRRRKRRGRERGGARRRCEDRGCGTRWQDLQIS